MHDFDEAVAQNDAVTADDVNSEQVSDVESNGDDNEVTFGRPGSRQSYTVAAPTAGRDRLTAVVGSDSSSEGVEALRLKLLMAREEREEKEREREMERERLAEKERERQWEREKIQLGVYDNQNSHQNGNGNSVNIGTAALAPVLPKMVDSDILTFFSSYERIMTLNGIPKTDWSKFLGACLTKRSKPVVFCLTCQSSK